MSAWQSLFHKKSVVEKINCMWEFMSMHGITVSARLLYGFICVRILPLQDYAKFAVVSGLIGTISILMDVNMSGTLAPLIGERVNNKSIIADYVASLRKVVHILFIIVSFVVLFSFPLIVRHQHWGIGTILVMLSFLLATCWFVRMSGAYGAALIINRSRKIWYRAQVNSSIGSVLLLAVLYFSHVVSAYCAVAISFLSAVYVAMSYYYHAEKTLGCAGIASREKQNEIVHLAMPNMPNAIFFALQGQISLMLITAFGRDASVAGVGALGRLAQIFVFFGQMNFLLLEPYFASLPEKKFKKNYVMILLAQTCICLLIVAASYCFPQAFLWILGGQYSNLRREVFLVIASGSISYLSGVLWGIHSARKFVYWWNSSTYIVATLLVQIWFIYHIDLSSIYSVLILNLASACIALFVNFSAGIYGMVFGPRCRASDIRAAESVGI